MWHELIAFLTIWNAIIPGICSTKAGKPLEIFIRRIVLKSKNAFQKFSLSGNKQISAHSADKNRQKAFSVCFYDCCDGDLKIYEKGNYHEKN